MITVRRLGTGEVIYETSADTLAGTDCRMLVLTKAALAGLDLTNCNLTGVVLAGADLSTAVMDGALARSALLFGADLRRASWRAADLRGASLQGARLGGTCFDGADLRGAQFARDASNGLASSSLVGAVWDRLTIWPYAFDVGACGARYDDDSSDGSAGGGNLAAWRDVLSLLELARDRFEMLIDGHPGAIAPEDAHRLRGHLVQATAAVLGVCDALEPGEQGIGPR